MRRFRNNPTPDEIKHNCAENLVAITTRLDGLNDPYITRMQVLAKQLDGQDRTISALAREKRKGGIAVGTFFQLGITLTAAFNKKAILNLAGLSLNPVTAGLVGGGAALFGRYGKEKLTTAKGQSYLLYEQYQRHGDNERKFLERNLKSKR